jgi:hypothetical protein
MNNLNSNIRKEGKTHIAQGVESTTRSIIGDNIDEVKQEHEESIMLQRVILKP